MTTPPTDQQLADIEARASAATPGPWGFYDGDNYADVAADMQMTGPGSYSYREKIARLEDENYWDDQEHEDHAEERAAEQMVANAAFIAHAPEDVRVLLAEVRRLRAELTTAYQTAASIADEAVSPDLPRSDYDQGRIDAGRDIRSWVEHIAVVPAIAVVAHVVADDSDDPEHMDGCPGCEDTLPAWLNQRFGTRGQHAQTWDGMSEDDRSYWEHQARAVHRAVTRGGFKAAVPAGGE
jgi:hypothetical protein